MRNLSRVSLIAVAVAAMLTGCVGEPSHAPPTSAATPSATPLFASDAEALAAATAAYAAYLKVSDEIFGEGGVDAARLGGVSTGDQLAANLEGFAKAKSLHERSSGITTFDTVTLQGTSPESVGDRSLVVLYLCEDVSRVDVLNEQGTSVVSPDRPDRAGYQVEFESISPASNHLVVASKEPWPAVQC
jgi:hypothetical protein